MEIDMTLVDKYHLPHNSIRIDEFNHMLKSIDLSKEYYQYHELRLIFLKKQIEDDVLKVFHPRYDLNLKYHSNPKVIKIYNLCIENPTNDNLEKLLNVQYTPKKTFKQVFNETVRDYTEFFAFLGLLPTYYKGKAGGEKRHYITSRLKDYIAENISLEDLLFDFKYRNSSKDYESLTMYHIKVRPFIIALKSANKYFDLGFKTINPHIISAIVIYSKNENVDDLISKFHDPTLTIKDYESLFVGEFDSIENEIGRATLFLKPYLIELGYLRNTKIGNRHFYSKGDKTFDDSIYANKVAFCNEFLGSISLTPSVGKILFKLYSAAKAKIQVISKQDLFDNNIEKNDINFLCSELKEMGVISNFSSNSVEVSHLSKQYSINPYIDFFDYEDSKYAYDIEFVLLNREQIVFSSDTHLLEQLNKLRPIALSSDGEKYEEELYKLLESNFDLFSVKWLGSNSVGKRLSDIIVEANIFDGSRNKKIAIIIECKAGKSVRSFDERKEIDDIINTLSREENYDGIWFWVVNGDALPSVDQHGGYRTNALSKSFMEKLLDIQFMVSEYMRVPTIVTAFSFNAISNYLLYLFNKTKNINSKVINKVNVEHFWRWSKEFMNLQYVMVHKELGVLS